MSARVAAHPASARVVLQAGGRGARLRPATDSVPKPLLRVGGVPLIERLFHQLADVGFRRFTVVTGWLGDAVEEHMRRLAGSVEDVRLDFIHEDKPLGNVGALRSLPPRPEPTLFVCSDLVTEMDFAALVAFHMRAEADITLASHTVARELEYGHLICDGDRVRAYVEKPSQEFTVCSGVGVFSSTVLRRMRRLVPPIGICDVVNDAISECLTVVHWPHAARWFDINSPEALRALDGSMNGDLLRSAAEASALSRS